MNISVKILKILAAAILIVSGLCSAANSPEKSIERRPFQELFSCPQFHEATSGIIFPRWAIKQNIEGAVVVEFILKKDGRVTNIKILSTPHSILNETVLNAVKKLEGCTIFGEDVFFVWPVSFTIDRS